MKWPARLALLLVVLALAAWAVRGPSRGHEARTTVALDGAPAASEVEAPVTLESERDARTSLAPLASAAAALPEPGFVGPPAPAAPPRRTSSVVIRVLHAGTRESASAGTVLLRYQVPRDGRASVAAAQRSATAELDPGGQAEFELPVGSSLGELALAPLPELLQGPRTHENARGRYLPRRIELERETSQADLELDVEVQHGVDLAGRVFDAESGEAVAGASVRLVLSWHSTPRTQSERDGSFVLGEVDARASADESQRSALWVEHEDYPEARVPVDIRRLAPVDVHLRRGFRVEGRVLDERGESVGSAKLELRLHGRHGGAGAEAVHFALETFSDAHGGFRFSPVAGADSARIEVLAREAAELGSLALQRDLGPLDADLEGLELVVAPSVAVCVRARRPDGELVLASDLLLVSEDGQRLSQTSSVCDALGRIAWVPLGRRFDVVAIAGDLSSACLRGVQSVEIDAARNPPQEVVIPLLEQGRVELPPLPEGAREFGLSYSTCLRGAVDVRLQDASGKPLPREVLVQFHCGGMWSELAPVGGGTLRVVGSPGRHSIEAWLANGVHDAFEVVIPCSGHACVERRLRLSR